MIFSYNWLKDYIKGNLPRPEKLAELLTMKAFEVKEVRKSGGDFVLDIDVLPNRGPDCFSHLGIARECAAITNLVFRGPTSVKTNRGRTSASFVSVEVRGKGTCSRYTARVVQEVKVGTSPKWLKDRLGVCGLRPINNIVDIMNYVMLETGQPLHAFDGGKLEGKKIIVRFAKEGEKIITLDEKKYDLNDDVLVIADAKKPIAIAGIKGGKSPEITKSTKIVVIESANFNPGVIRRGSKSLGLKTDASLRFEHGIDPNLTEFAINRAGCLIQKIAGGNMAKGLIDVYPQKIYPKRIRLNLDYVKSLLGLEIPQREIKKILITLGMKCNASRPRYIEVEVPTRRLDITIPEDLIEEIARIYEYEKISATFPIAALIPPKRNEDLFWEDISKNTLKEAGFTEVYNYSFIGEVEARIFGYTQKELFELENPMTREQKFLRPSLIPNLLKNVERNIKHIQEIKIFELGKAFEKTSGEKRNLTGLIVGDGFYQLKGVIDLLLQGLGISNIWYDSYRPTPERSKKSFWHPKKCAEIKTNHEEIGFLGEISPKILGNLEIPAKVVVFDLDFEKLQKLTSEEHEYRPISRFPSAIRDLAVLVPRLTGVEEVLNKIETAGGLLVRDVDLFDIYEGEELPEGKKNLAFHIIYQAEDKTLTSKEVDAVHQKIIKTLEENPEWQVRK